MHKLNQNLGEQPTNDHVFKIEDCPEYSSFHKYLGILFDGFSTLKMNSENLEKSGWPVLRAIISKIHTNGSVVFRTFEKIYLSGVAPILDYCNIGVLQISILNLYNTVSYGISCSFFVIQ